MAKRYDESSVRKLRGIEPVQRLPGMYTRTSDPTHIIQEAIDNAADVGDHERATLALKQAFAERILQLLDLGTDGGL